MQDRYAGDIGDFGKFSLLRNLFKNEQYKIGVIWYRYPDESHNDDGRHVDYLDKPEFKSCDSQLIDRFSAVVNNKRSIKSLEKAKLLPKNTVYYSVPLTFYKDYPGQKAFEKQARKDARKKWLADAVDNVSECNVVFLDPDNGPEIKSVPGMTQKTSGKYAFYSEVDEFCDGKNVCIIYHHLIRNDSHGQQLKQRAVQLSSRINDGDVVFALRYSPYSPRAYFILTIQSEVESMRKRLKDFMSGLCGYGWDSYYEI